MERMLCEFTDAELREEAGRRGYELVSSTKPLSWNRTVPIPEGVDFEVEALSKLREQITAEMIDFQERPSRGEFDPVVKSAFLRVLRYRP